MNKKIGQGKRSRKLARRARKSSRVGSATASSVTVTFRHVEPTEALRQYAERKLARVARFLKRPCEAHLILSVDKYRQHGEVTVKSGRLAVTAQEETKDLYSVIDLLADKVERQLKRTLEKISAKKTRPLSPKQSLAASEGAPSGGL